MTDLASLFLEIVATPASRAGHARALVPGPDAVSFAIQDADAASRILAAYARILPSEGDDAGWARLLEVPTDRTRITPISAPGAALQGHVPDPRTSAFPNGVLQVARVLRPEVTFTEVECRAPTASSGTRFHLLFPFADSWVMLGPIWRFLA